MPIQIEVQDLHAKLLIDFYIQRLKILKTEIIERERELKEINVTIQKLKKGNSEPSIINNTSKENSQENPYLEKWTWVKKIQFAIKQQGKPLTTKEVVETLTEYEAEFIFDRKRVVASVSSMLSTKSGDGKEFVRVESDSGEFAYDINPDFKG